MRHFDLCKWLRLTCVTGVLPACMASAQDGTATAAAQNAAPRVTGAAVNDVTHDALSLSMRLVDRLLARGEQWLGIQPWLWRYICCFGLLLVTLATARLVRWFFEKYARRLAANTRWEIDDLMFEAAGRPAHLFVLAIGVFWAGLFVLAGDAPQMIVDLFGRACFAVAAGAVLWYVYRVVDVLDHYMRKMAGRSDNDLDDSFVDVARKTLRLFLLFVGVLFIGKNVLNWDVTALLASAGVLGLAVAFAAQDTIANFFGTLMLLLDKPFKVGERIKLEGAEGPVESIGFRSTRVRTLDGHQVSIPNKEMANVTIENVGRRPHIKRVSNLTLTYDTPVAKVERALDIVRGLLKDHPGMDSDWPPRVFFNEFNDWSLNILLIAWYHPAEYWDYLAWCEQVNLELMRQFEAEGIEFAFPTTTTYLAQDDRRPLVIRTGPLPDSAAE